MLFVGAAYALSALAGALIGFVATHANYAYVHSLWHILLAVSLALLVPQCSSARAPACFATNAVCSLACMRKSISHTTVLSSNQDESHRGKPYRWQPQSHQLTNSTRA